MVKSGISRDKLIYNQNNVKQNYPSGDKNYCKCEPTNQDLLSVPKVFKPIPKRSHF